MTSERQFSGRTETAELPLFILLVSGGINVVLNLIFVILLRMNVTGVTAATVISTALSAGAVLFLLIRENSYLRPAFSCLDKENVREIVRIGLPAALQGAVFCFANIFVQAAVNSFGADAAAGSAVAMRGLGYSAVPAAVLISYFIIRHKAKDFFRVILLIIIQQKSPMTDFFTVIGLFIHNTVPEP